MSKGSWCRHGSFITWLHYWYSCLNTGPQSRHIWLNLHLCPIFIMCNYIIQSVFNVQSARLIERLITQLKSIKYEIECRRLIRHKLQTGSQWHSNSLLGYPMIYTRKETQCGNCSAMYTFLIVAIFYTKCLHVLSPANDICDHSCKRICSNSS